VDVSQALGLKRRVHAGCNSARQGTLKSPQVEDACGKLGGKWNGLNHSHIEVAAPQHERILVEDKRELKSNEYLLHPSEFLLILDEKQAFFGRFGQIFLPFSARKRFLRTIFWYHSGVGVGLYVMHRGDHEPIYGFAFPSSRSLI
jgi:hypothetical protein